MPVTIAFSSINKLGQETVGFGLASSTGLEPGTVAQIWNVKVNVTDSENISIPITLETVVLTEVSENEEGAKFRAAQKLNNFGLNLHQAAHQILNVPVGT